MTAQKQVKILIAPADHDRLRLAAALRRTTMVNFCRQVVLAEASRLTETIQVPSYHGRLGTPTEGQSPNKRSTK